MSYLAVNMLIGWYIISLLLTLFYCFFIGRNIIAWAKTKPWQIKNRKPVLGVSIVLAVRNEAIHIKKCLESLQNQDYPKALFEIIIVDDYSKDNTVEIIKSTKAANTILLHLKDILTGEETMRNYKKKALAMGVANAKHDIIMTTDGDCKAGRKWLRTMADYYSNNNCLLVAGPLIYQKSNAIFENSQALEILGLAGITAGQFFLKEPIMCNGANLLFDKKIFLEAQNTTSYKAYASGDDAFLLQYVRKKFPCKTGFVKSINATVTTFAEKTLSGFLQQRLRWSSKTKSINKGAGTMLMYAVFCFEVSLLMNCIFGVLFSNYLLLVGAIMFLTKSIFDFVLLYKTSRFFKQIKLLWLFLFSQIFQLVYISLFGLFIFKRGYIWKQRQVKESS